MVQLVLDEVRHSSGTHQRRLGKQLIEVLGLGCQKDPMAMEGMFAFRPIFDDYIGQLLGVEVSVRDKYRLVLCQYTSLLCIARERIRRRVLGRVPGDVLVGLHQKVVQ